MLPVLQNELPIGEFITIIIYLGASQRYSAIEDTYLESIIKLNRRPSSLCDEKCKDQLNKYFDYRCFYAANHLFPFGLKMMMTFAVMIHSWKSQPNKNFSKKRAFVPT